jgi:dienelactone hydrolase
LLIHQYEQDLEQWGAFPEKLVEAGFVVLRIDLRGHGSSDAQDGELSEILTSPDQAPLDLKAALAHFDDLPSVDRERVAVVGTSIGGNLSVVGMSEEYGVQAIVPISSRESSIHALAGGEANLSALTHVSCYAGELDNEGAQAETCHTLIASATGTAVEKVYAGTSAHGLYLLEERPEIEDEIVDWLLEVL